VVNSNRENLYDLWETQTGAYGQQASTINGSEGPQQNFSNPPPMTSPEVPSIVPVSTGPWPALPVVHSNRENLHDLRQTQSGAYGQASTINGLEGLQPNLDVPPTAQDPPWNSYYWDIPSASDNPVWDSQNPYIPAAIPDTPWGSDNLRPTPIGAYGQQPSTINGSEGLQQNKDVPPTEQDPPWYSYYLDIPSASHNPAWDSQYSYIPPAIPDAPWDSENLHIPPPSPGHRIGLEDASGPPGGPGAP
jgi:hypothetical protein